MPLGLHPFTEPREKLRVQHAADRVGAPSPEEFKVKTAELVRANARERAALTSAAAIGALAPDEPEDRLTAILAEMAAEARFADIKAVITATGAVHLYSEAHLGAGDAVDKAFVEECEELIASRVRTDSRGLALTPLRALQALAPGTEAGRIEAIARRLGTDPLHADLEAVTTAKGDLFLHSTHDLSSEDAGLLVADDPAAALAHLVREASRTYPRPTPCRPLLWARAFRVAPEKLGELIDDLLRRPGCGDLERLVHPSTGAVYLFSSRHLDGQRAFELMDWEEVGRAANP